MQMENTKTACQRQEQGEEECMRDQVTVQGPQGRQHKSNSMDGRERIGDSSVVVGGSCSATVVVMVVVTEL